MNDHPSTSEGTARTATFYAFKTITPESLVIVALRSWLGPMDGWATGDKATFTRPDGMVAKLDPNSVYKRYSDLNPSFCDILNVLTCPAKPNAESNRAEIVKAWNLNGTARLQWRNDADEVVLGPIYTQYPNGTRVMEPPPPMYDLTDTRPTSQISGNSQTTGTQRNRLISGREISETCRITITKIDDQDPAYPYMKGLSGITSMPLRVQIQPLSLLSSGQGSLKWEEDHPSVAQSHGNWGSISLGALSKAHEQEGSDRNIYVELSQSEAQRRWRHIQGIRTKAPYSPLFYKLDEAQQITYGVFRNLNDAPGILGRSRGVLKAWATDGKAHKMSYQDSEGSPCTTVLSSSPDKLNQSEAPYECPVPQLKKPFPWSPAEHHMVQDMCEGQRKAEGSR